MPICLLSKAGARARDARDLQAGEQRRLAFGNETDSLRQRGVVEAAAEDPGRRDRFAFATDAVSCRTPASSGRPSRPCPVAPARSAPACSGTSSRCCGGHPARDPRRPNAPRIRACPACARGPARSSAHRRGCGCRSRRDNRDGRRSWRNHRRSPSRRASCRPAATRRCPGGPAAGRSGSCRVRCRTAHATCPGARD